MITVDCRGEGSVQNGRKSDDVICERSLNRKSTVAYFNKYYGIISVCFCRDTEKSLFVEVSI